MPQILPGSLYDYPKYYDLVFGSDWKAEFDFLLDVFDRYTSGRTMRVFEPACGTGRLLFRLGRLKLDVLGLDLNAKAIGFCNQRLRKYGLPESAFVGDMTDFRLPKKVDVAFNMINSFRHLTTTRQASEHIRCMGQAIRKGGVYVLGLHLTPTKTEPVDEESWVARRGHLQVNSRLWTLDRDMKRRRELFGMTYDIFTPSGHWQLYNEIEFRTYTVPQFQKLIRDEGSFAIHAVHDFAYDIEEDVELDEYAEDIVFILRRK
ncbi:MAG TPA: class I SAM-dependent methyltransferase [Planctomycetes bacterium]|nr:class I SAM-dependent methyltransferase [Planctomycetaceae bacterium]HIK93963.1 class I SAM-dependent methyltransferase [Planctomycetota bacterium]